MGGPPTIDGIAVKELDNFYECSFNVDSKTFCSAENYYQCCKAKNEKDFEYVRKSGHGLKAWASGNKIKKRSDWEKIKVRSMYIANKEKIQQNEEIAKILCDTTGEIICTQSTDFWNSWNSNILTLIRAELRNSGEEDIKVAQEIWGLIEQYESSH